MQGKIERLQELLNCDHETARVLVDVLESIAERKAEEAADKRIKEEFEVPF